MFGPGATPHQINEYVEKEKYLRFIDYYKELLITYLNEYK